jgi:glycosyltransferase involved in cell wall biosynthesis
MRVLHVYSGNLFGGVESILVSLARQRSRHLEHEFALSFQGRLDRELAGAGARIHHLGAVRMSRPASARAARASLAALIRASAYDRVICHAPWSQAIFGGVVKRTGAPLVFWAHDVMTGRHWTERLARRVVPDLVICNSEFTSRSLGSLYPGVAAKVVYAPVDAASPLGREERQTMRKSFDTPERAVVVVQACRSERWKGHEVLVEALSELRTVPNWIWWQVGGAQRAAEAAYLASIKQRARRLGIVERVRWAGERDDVPRLLAAADLYCQPNLEPEPFGIVLVEALAAGLPVVTSSLGGALEIVDDSCGVLVPPRDQFALAHALGSLIEDEQRRSRLASAAPSRARRLCDPDVAIERLALALHGVKADMPAVGA